MPVPGWDATYDWKGYLKFEDLPRYIDPPGGAIGTANARIVPPELPAPPDLRLGCAVPPAAHRAS